MKTLVHFFEFPDIKPTIANEDDKADLIKLINHAFSYQTELKGEERIDEKGLMKKMSKTDFYVWKSGDDLAACCYVEPLVDRVHFGLLCVADSYRGSGLAPAIMKSIEDYAVDRGNEIVELDYMSISQWLKTYYERFGFKETGIREDIGWGDIVQMRKSLTRV